MKKKICLSLIVLLVVGIFGVGSVGVKAAGIGDRSASEYLDDMATRYIPGAKVGVDEAGNPIYADPLKKSDLPTMIGLVIYGILGFLGIICLVIIIAAGIMWMNAGGSEETVKNARGMIKGAAYGVVVVLAAYAITFFVTTTILDAVVPETEVETDSTNDDYTTDIECTTDFDCINMGLPPGSWCNFGQCEINLE